LQLSSLATVAKRLKKRVTIRLDEVTIAYFKQLAQESGIRYQTLINLYLRDCAASNRRLQMAWKPPKSAKAAS
jgi:predicted DNA binding CopG/RHH family protein